MPKVFNISFSATLYRPADEKDATWMFLQLPQGASEQLPSRGMVSAEGTVAGKPILTTLEPDGKGGHWMRVQEELQQNIRAKPGDNVDLELHTASKDPEPEVPEDFAKALAEHPRAEETWNATTPAARRDWVSWIVSGKKAETRVKRIEVACSKMNAGSRRPCCFDRSGMYSHEFSAPEAEPL